jgi:hypothetical protein
MSKIPVYKNEELIAYVESNSNLDFWDGHNMTCGSTGLHKGLTRLKKSKEFVLIHGTQWQGQRTYAEVISPQEAYQEIAQSRNYDLLDKWPELKKLDAELDSEDVPRLGYLNQSNIYQITETVNSIITDLDAGGPTITGIELIALSLNVDKSKYDIAIHVTRVNEEFDDGLRDTGAHLD